MKFFVAEILVIASLLMARLPGFFSENFLIFFAFFAYFFVSFLRTSSFHFCVLLRCIFGCLLRISASLGMDLGGS
jgi:hypothetical protein